MHKAQTMKHFLTHLEYCNGVSEINRNKRWGQNKKFENPISEITNSNLKNINILLCSPTDILIIF